MLHTAKFVHTHGGQTEIILRVKQGRNPTFGFLMPEDPLHPFFRFMVDNYERLADTVRGNKPESKGSGVKEKDAVSLVAAAYADDDDEESENEDGVPPFGEIGEEEGGDAQEEAERHKAAEGLDLSAEGKQVGSGSLLERSGGLDADAGVRGAASDGSLGKDAEPCSEALEADPLSSEAAGRSDVGTEPQDAHRERVPSSPEVVGKGAEVPSAPTVKFVIAKNPPLAAVRRVKQEATVSTEEKEQSVGSERGGRPDAQVEGSVNTQDSSSLLIISNADGAQPLASGVNEPQAAVVNGPPTGGVNEPPLQMQRVIEKMVEFIARNGEQFEAVVRAKDEGERRFPFLAPGNSYHGYFKKLLGEALKGPGSTGRVDTQQPADVTTPSVRSSEPDPSTAPFETLDNRLGSPHGSEKEAPGSLGVEIDEQAGPLFFGETEEATGNERFDQPAGLGSDAVRAAVLAATRTGSFGSHTELKGLEKRVKKRGLSPVASKQPEEKGAQNSTPVGLGIDAVRAAVMRATRTPSPSISANLETKGPSEAKPSGLRIDAVRAAVIKATRGKAFPDQNNLGDRSVSDGQRDLGPVSLPAAQNVGLSAPLADTKAASFSGIPAPSTGLTAARSGSLNPETLSERAAVEAARAAAAAAGGEADSSDVRLTAPEQKKAERLKRAKMFAAMLTGGTASAEVLQGSGSLALSGAGSLEVPEPQASGPTGAGVPGAGADVSGDVSGKVRNAATGAGDVEIRRGVQDTGMGVTGGEKGASGPSEAEKGKQDKPKEESETKGDKEGGRHAGTGSVDGIGGEKRRRKRDGRHRDREDETRGETREERRRRRKERRERRAREDEADGKGADVSEGEGSDVEREERRRRKLHRHQHRREHREARGGREESPEEGEICANDGVDADESAEGGREKGRNGRAEEETQSCEERDASERKGRGAEWRRGDGEAGDATKRRRGRSRSRDRRSRRESIVGHKVGGSDSKNRVEASRDRLLSGDRSMKSVGHEGKASTRLSLEEENEAAPAVLVQEGTSGAAEGHVEVPESVRAKVRAMLGLL